MAEVEKRVQNGEMPPQEDSSKVPLTDSNDAAVAIKNESAPVTETKVDMPEEFKGLTKDELMQYAKDPFWVRLRIFLMVLFWLGWVAMLSIAILIIVRAPACEPPPTSTWLQESPILQFDVPIPTPGEKSDAVSLMENLGVSSLYIPGLIADHDYYKMNATYVKESVLALLQEVTGAGGHVVTDFVPNPARHNHLWLGNSSYRDLMDFGTRTLNYDNPELKDELMKVFEFWESEYNVTGFLVSSEELNGDSALRNITRDLNAVLNPSIVIGESAVDMSQTLDNLNNPGDFKDFVSENTNDDDWTYYKFRPVFEQHRTASPEQMPPVTLALMMLEGTPLAQVSNDQMKAFEETLGSLFIEGVKLRENDAIKFGETQFANATEEVVAFTRLTTLKGTPGYAVAVNLGSEQVEVSFEGLNHVPMVGTEIFRLTEGEPSSSTKVDLKKVTVDAHDGVVLQFVAQYS